MMTEKKRSRIERGCSLRWVFIPSFLASLISFGGTGFVSDDFNRPNTGPVTAATIPNPIGAQYSVVSGTWEIGAGSYLQSSAGGILYDTRVETSRFDDYRFTLRVNVLHPNYAAGSSSRQAGIVLNYQDADNHYVIRWGYETDGLLGNIQVVRRRNGSNAAIGTLVSGLPLPGGWYTWVFSSSSNANEITYSISPVGSSVPIYTGSFTDSAFTAGYAGFYRSGGGTVRFDDYSLKTVDTALIHNEITVSYDLYGRNYRFAEDQPHVPPDPDTQLTGTLTLLPENSGELPVTIAARFTGRDGAVTDLTALDQVMQLTSGIPVSIPFTAQLPQQSGHVVLSTQSSDPGILFMHAKTETPVYAGPIVPAFPGAVGFGAFTPGGRGGTIYKVTTLEDYAANETPIEGSLRFAAEKPGPRIIVFAVSGTVWLKRELVFSNPYITVAGNTAPFPGITIAGYQTAVRTDHAVLRYLRFRLSVDILRQRFAAGNHSEWDSFQANGGEYILLDHLSGSHSVDETLSMTQVDRASMQHCLAAYSLNSVFHPKWPDVHNFGGLTGYIGRPDRHAAVSSIYNAWINHDRRMPGLSAVEDPANLASWIDLRYSLMYNWKSNAAGSEAPEREAWRQNYHLNFVGNYLKPGPGTLSQNLYAGLTVRGSLNKLWLEDNRHDADVQSNSPTDQPGLIRYIYSDVSGEHFLSQPVPAPSAAAPEVAGTKGILTDFVGASIPARDSVDYAAVLDVLNNTGYHPYADMDTDTSPPLPELVSIRHVYHNEEDLFPVWWKRLQGLPDDAAIDPHADSNGDGYTNIEAYMHGLNLNDPAVQWAVPANNINPLDRLTGEETFGLSIPSAPVAGWSDREVNETVFSGADGLTVMSSSTAEGNGSHGVRNILDPSGVAWSSGGASAHIGPAGARMGQGHALVLAFPAPRKISEILIHRTDPDAYPATHDPAGALLQGLKGWPDHWVDLAEENDLPAFSAERRMHPLVIPESLRGPYAAYRLIFPSAHGSGDLRIQHITFDSSELRAVEVSSNEERRGYVSGGGLYAKDAPVTLVPQPSEYFSFSRWSGDVPSGREADVPLTFPADTDRILVAHFSEVLTEGTGTPVWWLAEHGLTEPSFEDAAQQDHNGNGLAAWKEFIAGIDPGPEGSQDRFLFHAPAYAEGGLTIRWPSREGRRYAIQSAEALTDEFETVSGAGDLPATPPVNEWVIEPSSGEKSRFFRVQVRYPAE